MLDRRSCITLALFLALLPGAEAALPRFEPSPLLPPSSRLLKNTAYDASFNRAHKQADWVFYGLSKRELRNCVERNGSFRADERLERGIGPELSDYSGSGYDRGHLPPAADNRWNAVAMRESFLLSNVSPQPSRFNGGIWARLEALVRAWAAQGEGLWVATGPLLRPKLPVIGTGVSVPEYFYKALATKDGTRAVAFVLPVDASGELTKYEMSVDQLENISGLDFLAGMDREEELEGSYNASQWDLKAKFTARPCSGKGQQGFFEWTGTLAHPLEHF